LLYFLLDLVLENVDTMLWYELSLFHPRNAVVVFVAISPTVHSEHNWPCVTESQRLQRYKVPNFQCAVY